MKNQHGFASFLIIMVVVWLLSFGVLGFVMMNGKKFIAIKAYQQEINEGFGVDPSTVPNELVIE